MQFISTVVITFLTLLSVAFAAPILVERDVFVPPVLEPNSHSVWKIGSTQVVTWDVSSPPDEITNNEAQVILVTNGRLDMEHPLAKGINVLKGKATVKVPNVKPGNDYQILVFGDSGNTGEFFTITK